MFFLLTPLKHNFLKKCMAWGNIFLPWVILGWEGLINPWWLLAFGFRDNESKELLRGNFKNGNDLVLPAPFGDLPEGQALRDRSTKLTLNPTQILVKFLLPIGFQDYLIVLLPYLVGKFPPVYFDD